MRNLLYFKILTFSGYVSQNSRTATMTMNKTKLIKIAIILIYLFSPIDILPEAVLGPLGLVDDAAAIALLIRILLKK